MLLEIIIIDRYYYVDDRVKYVQGEQEIGYLEHYIYIYIASEPLIHELVSVISKDRCLNFHGSCLTLSQTVNA